MAIFHNKKGDSALDNEVYQEFLEHIPGGLFRYKADDEPGELDFVNNGICSIFGCDSFEEFTELTGDTFRGIVYPDDWERVKESIQDQIKEVGAARIQYRIKRADGDIRWVDDSARLVTDSAGNKWIYTTLIDITDQVENRKQLERANERLEILTALSNDVLFDIECETGETHVYGDFEGRFGRKPEQPDFVVHRRCKNDCQLKIESHDLSELISQIEENSLVDFCTSSIDKDGEPIWYRYQSVVLYKDDGQPVRHVGRLLDTHDMIMRETQFRRKAERDALTGLYNRSAALDRINSTMATETRPCTLIAVDVDDFKDVNDTYGHPEGDRVLKDLATFLSQVMRSEDVVARIGGDEFIVFAPGLEPGPAMERVLTHLTRGPFASSRAADDEPAEDGSINEGALPNLASPSISVGAACCMKPPMDYDDLYAVADDALYQAKAAGKADYKLTVIE